MTHYNLLDISPDFARQMNLMHLANQYNDVQVIPFFMQQVKPQKPGVPRNRDLYKTALCDHWCYRNYCPYGTECWFAHGPEELRIAQFLTRNKGTSISNNPNHENHQENASDRRQISCASQFQASNSTNSSFDRVIGSEWKKNKVKKEIENKRDSLGSSNHLDSGIDSESKGSETENSKLESNDSSCSSYNLWDNSFSIMLPLESPNTTLEKQRIRTQLGDCDFFRASGTCMLGDNCCFNHFNH